MNWVCRGLPATLDHRSDWARGLAALPTVHFGPKSAVLTRTGKPVPKALRNERIRKFNKILEGIHLRRLLAHPTVLLATSDRQHPLQEISSARAQGLLQNVRDELGPDWLGMRVRDRLRLIREASDEVLLIGPGFVVTSAPSAVSFVAAVASRLGLSKPIGYAGQDADAEVKGPVDQELARRGQRCDWRGRRVARAAMVMSR